MTEQLGTFVKLWEKDGGGICFTEGSEHTIDAAVDHWLETGRDSIVHLVQVGGDSYHVLASHITSWSVSTAAGRRADSAIYAASRARIS